MTFITSSSTRWCGISTGYTLRIPFLPSKPPSTAVDCFVSTYLSNWDDSTQSNVSSALSLIRCTVDISWMMQSLHHRESVAFSMRKYFTKVHSNVLMRWRFFGAFTCIWAMLCLTFTYICSLSIAAGSCPAGRWAASQEEPSAVIKDSSAEAVEERTLLKFSWCPYALLFHS